MKISLFASSVRPQLYESFFKSIEDEPLKYEIEVVFAGNNICNWGEWESFNGSSYVSPCYVSKKYRNFLYVRTENIKPSQCYEIARRHCTGEVIVWVADDCEFVGGIISKAYEYWKSKNNEKLILSIQTKESGYGNKAGSFFDMHNHSFFGFDHSTPLMAPLAMMGRDYLDRLGGIDRRYVCGQYENDLVMRAVADGGKVEIFGNQESFIDIDHLGKSLSIGECTNERDFQRRPFASGYEKDRQVLEGSWAKGRVVSLQRFDSFEPFEDKDLLTVSQSNKGQWE
jgi:hypothetical protein